MSRESINITEETEHLGHFGHALTLERHNGMSGVLFITIASKTRYEEFYCSSDDFRELVRRVLGEGER